MPLKDDVLEGIRSPQVAVTALGNFPKGFHQRVFPQLVKKG